MGSRQKQNRDHSRVKESYAEKEKKPQLHVDFLERKRSHWTLTFAVNV